MFEIRRAIFPHDLEGVIDIYREYIENTSVSLEFQNNEGEFPYLCEKYSGVESKIFLAVDSDKIIGCAAFKKVCDQICEMKRVYVRPVSRGKKIGAQLIERVIEEASQVGYEKICLDVLPEFKQALKLYMSFGFETHEAISHNPVPGTEFLGLNLQKYNKVTQEMT